MKTKKLIAVTCACALVTGVFGGTLSAYADADGETTTNLFRAPGFDAMLLEEETEYKLSPEQRSHTGSLTFDSAAVAKRETDGNVYLELKYDGEHGFASFFSMMTVSEAGDYRVSVDFKKGENWKNTDNLGFRFFSPTDCKDSKGWANDIKAAAVGEWVTLTEVYSVSAASQPGVDSFSLWYNTMADADNVLMVDNVVIEYIVPEEDAPAVVGETTKVFKEDEAADVEFGLDLKGKDITSVKVKGSDDALTSGYTYAEGKITFDSDYVLSLGEGSHELVIATEGGEVSVVITVYLHVEQIPDTTDGYELKSTMKGGDFESYEVGLKFSDAQTDEAWGSLAGWDDVGTIVDDNGNHALRLGRTEGSVRTYSSAFCMTSPEIELGDIVTLKFAYKIVGGTYEDLGRDSNVTFVGSSNVGYHSVNFDNSAITTEYNANEQAWPVKRTAGENGYTNVEMSFIVDFAFLNATNSLRFLYQISEKEGVDLYIDNVELLRWVEEGSEDDEVPTVVAENVTFDGKNAKDVTVTVDLKDYSISSLKCGNDTVAVKHYTLGSDDTVLTISKDYLATLDNGAHKFTITTLGGSCEFTVTVSNNTKKSEGGKGGCKSAVTGFAALGAGTAVIAAACVAMRTLSKRKER